MEAAITQLVDNKPFIARPEFWELEGTSPALEKDFGFLRANVDELLARCAKWPTICMGGISAPPPDPAFEPKDTTEFTKLFVSDSNRMFLSSEYRDELVMLLHVLGTQIGDYHQSLCQIGAFLSLTLPQTDALKIMLRLYDAKYLGGYFVNGAEMFVCDVRVWTSLLRRHNQVAECVLQNASVIPEAYLPRWFMSVFVDTLPFHSLFDVFERFLQHGIVFLFKFGLALVDLLWVHLPPEIASLELAAQLGVPPDTSMLLKLLNLDRDDFPAVCTPDFVRQVIFKAESYSIKTPELLELRGVHIDRMLQGAPPDLRERSTTALQYSGEHSSGKRHGIGVLKWASGAEYQGSFVNGLREGEGVQKYGNNSVYEGSWLADLRHGFGKLVESSGDQYVGEWFEDQPHGEGSQRNAIGDTYTGHWRNGKKHGYGEMAFGRGVTYSGDWVADKMLGKCKITFPDESFYEGHVVGGWPQGEGFMRFPRTKIMVMYEGQWHEGSPHGMGTSFYVDSSMYVGQFVDSLREGHGKLTYSDGTIYEGSFSQDKMWGMGKMTLHNGSSYRGEYVDGLPHGCGVMQDAKRGEVYEGEFESGRRSGNGTVVYSDGSKFLGTFRSGMKNGSGVLLSLEGWREVGHYAHDVKEGVHKRTFEKPKEVVMITYRKGVAVDPSIVPTSPRPTSSSVV